MHYFCIFCDFTCKEYDNAFDHYCSHMFATNNCEICDYMKYNDYKELMEYKSDKRDLSNKCDHWHRNHYTELTREQKIMIRLTNYWIKKFLSYQKKILDTTYEELLLANKICRECAVCRYLVEKYASNGGDMNHIQYISDSKVEHCYQHMRYNTNSGVIKECIARYENPQQIRVQRILKLELFIEHCCDTFFTGRDQINNNDSVVNNGKIDNNSVIHDNDNECLSCSEAIETVSQLSPSFEDTLQQSLAPILAKLSAVENEIANTNSRIDRNASELENTNSKIEKIKSNFKPDYFAQTTASMSEKLSVVESELNTIKSESNEAIPPATVAYFASPNAQIGWLKADGQDVSRTKYAKLFVTIGTTFGCGDGFNTFNLPDLRGEFIRGWSDGRDVDKTRAFGSFQWGSSIPMGCYAFNREVGVIGQQDLSFARISFDNSFGCNVKSGQTCDGITYPSGSMTDIDSGDWRKVCSWDALKGTRPRNIALLACIKY